jgi:threonine/homoserine/homoserine lactone efflux protein
MWRIVIDSSHFIEFFVASSIIIIAPGPSVMFTIARGVAWGKWTAVLTTLGNSLGALVLSVLVAVGLGPLISHSKLFSAALQFVGGCYLIWLGIEAFQKRKAHAAAMLDQDNDRPSKAVIIRQGFVVGVLNPKALIFFAAVFPHFVDRSKGHVTLQLLIFGLLFSVMAFFSDGTWGYIAGTARDWLATSPNRLIALRTIGASVMMILGILIIISAFSTL